MKPKGGSDEGETERERERERGDECVWATRECIHVYATIDICAYSSSSRSGALVNEYANIKRCLPTSVVLVLIETAFVGPISVREVDETTRASLRLSLSVSLLSSSSRASLYVLLITLAFASNRHFRQHRSIGSSRESLFSESCFHAVNSAERRELFPFTPDKIQGSGPLNIFSSIIALQGRSMGRDRLGSSHSFEPSFVRELGPAWSFPRNDLVWRLSRLGGRSGTTTRCAKSSRETERGGGRFVIKKIYPPLGETPLMPDSLSLVIARS